MSEKKKSASQQDEKTVIKCVSLMSVGGGGCPASVDVKNNQIVRIRPLHYDDKFNLDEFGPWHYERDGKTLEPLTKSIPGSYSMAYKKRVYSPNRILYPLKRVDWDPNGERNTQNRGKSKYKRISWDEATDIIAAEIKRIHKQYGPYAVLAQCDGHGECKDVHAPHGCQTILLDVIGGFTMQVRNPDSWEGWYWGARHVWGDGFQGLMKPQDNVQNDVTENTEMLITWGGDPETTPWGSCGQGHSRLHYFWSEIGIKQVYICPDLNYGAAVHADKWIPVLPNTDAALQLAIIYTWIKEDTYDKEYVRTHTVGFDKVKAYVMGEEDGVPKSPIWASAKCGVPARTIKALAREFASKVTSIYHYAGGGFIRGPFSHEPARLETILLGMQGLGKPGVHSVAGLIGGSQPRNAVTRHRAFLNDKLSARLTKPAMCTRLPWTKQQIPKTMLEEAILNPPITFWGNGAIDAATPDQFVKYTYPIPKEEGGTEIHMIWTDTPCRTTCWNDGYRVSQAIKSPKIEFFLAQHPWLENDCLLADIILPINTLFEIEDITTNIRGGVQWQSATLMKQAIQPIGESKSDYEAVLEVAKKLGVYDKVTEGKTASDLVKDTFKMQGLSKYITWEEFKDKEYYVYPTAKEWEKDAPGLSEFCKDPEKHPMPTPTGKLEFYSEALAKHYPDDQERPPIPKWIEKSEIHDERLSSVRAKAFPLLLISNHGHWRAHAQCDDITWTREAPTCKIRGWDGYMYEPLWINPLDAAKRGIKDGDIVKIFNERGIVLAGAYVQERVMPGTLSIDHGARIDFIIPGKVDRGGAINLISPGGLTSKRCAGMATSSYLVEVGKVTAAQMDEWKRQYPEAFSRKYDPASGLRFEGWVEG